VVEHPEVFDPAGLPVNGPPGTAGLPFTESTDCGRKVGKCFPSNAHGRYISNCRLWTEETEKMPFFSVLRRQTRVRSRENPEVGETGPCA
jgi:hypothetical protein